MLRYRPRRGFYGITGDRRSLVGSARGLGRRWDIPLGDVIVGDAVRAVLEADAEFVLRHGFTYSGHPTACAAGLTNLEIMEREGLLDRVPLIAAKLSDGFGALAASGRIAEVRGVGGMWAIGLHGEGAEAAVVGAMLEAGVIARGLPSTVTFCPPLVITEDELDQVVEVVTDAVS